MARLYDEDVRRFWLALPQAFEDPANPTEDEMNQNTTNDPSGLIWELTCALNTDGTEFSLEEPDYDESTSFCQKANAQEPMALNSNVVYQAFRATEEAKADGTAGWNTAHLAFTLLAHRGVEYLAILSTGKGHGEPVVAGEDEVSVVQVATDHGIDVIGSGEPVQLTQTFASRGLWAWNQPVSA